MKLTKQEIQYINIFDAVANVTARACYLEDNTVTYLVNEQDLGRAIGKNGSNVNRMRQRLGKNVEIIPFAADAQSFVAKALALFKVEAKEITEKNENGRKSLVVKLDAENKEKMLRAMGRFKRMKAILKKIFEVESVKLI